MYAEENLEIAHCFFDALNEHDPEAAERLFAPGFVFYIHRRPPEGIRGWQQWFTRFIRGFPDFQADVEATIADEANVVTRWTLRGTHLGMFWTIAPTGREVTMPAVSIHRIAGGKIVEYWLFIDELGLLEQLGVILVRGQPFPE
jgi:steroid delta-isomerase-like uncharacterized protein